MDTRPTLQALLASPQPGASTWLRYQDRIDVLATVDASRQLLRLDLALGRARCSHDAELAANLLRWNGAHLDVGSPCFSLDERDNTICLGSAVMLTALTHELTGPALERLVTAADEARAWLPDAILFFD